VTSPGGELVFVVPTSCLFGDAGIFGAARHGFFAPTASEWTRFHSLVRDEGVFVDRAPAELDPSLKQIIPYAVVAKGDSIFRFQRQGGGEARLLGKSSVGVGGHINPCDERPSEGLSDGRSEELTDVLRGGLDRELDEELVMPADRTAEFVGLINDDSTPVGSVHLGLVARVEVTGDVSVRETETMAGEFVDARELVANLSEIRAEFETWSSLLLDCADLVVPRIMRA